YPMASQPIVDADCHILEPPDIWQNWLPAKYADKAPQLVKDHEGGDAWLTAVGGDPDPIGLTATPGMPFDKFRWFGVTYDEARTGCYNGAARLADMDLDGVTAEILFPPQRTLSHFLGDDDEEFVLAGVEAYNNFLFEEFCAPDPMRLIGMAQIPSTGIDHAVAGLKLAAERGAKGVLISNWPAGNANLSRDDDPFWAAAAEMGMPVTIHINIISRAQRSASRRAAAAKGNKLYDMASEATRAKAIGGMSHVFSMTTGAMTDLIFTGVFERFPELQVVWIETGVGWIPHFLECLDDRWWRNRVWGDLPLSEPPSTYWFRNNAATFIVDRTGVELRNRVGVENMMWS
ncbi:MAG: amidohydrolase family protein, partial [Actinomycetota bacterium]